MMDRHDRRDAFESARDLLPAGFALAVLVALALVLSECTDALAQEAPERTEDVAVAIRTLQPAVDADRAVRLARIFDVAGEESDLDPLLLVALAMRESSFLEAVERGEVVGALGEIGLMQSHGVAIGYRPTGCDRDLRWHGDDDRRAMCQILTGARFLAAVREHCGGSWWRWVASYGASRCLTEDEARAHRSATNARRYYVEIGGAGW